MGNVTICSQYYQCNQTLGKTTDHVIRFHRNDKCLIVPYKHGIPTWVHPTSHKFRKPFKQRNSVLTFFLHFVWRFVPPQEECEEKYGKLVSIVRRAVDSAERRPNMSELLHVLSTDEPLRIDSSFSDGLSILCVGTGKGATALIHAEPSSSFVLLNNNKPVLLVDLGLGVTASYLQYMGKESNFNYTYITHNHADHAAELPVVLAALQGKRGPIDPGLRPQTSLPVVLAAPDVMHRLRTFRLNEICCEEKLDALAEWRLCNAFPKRTPIDKNGEFEISPIQSQHSEICYGFLLYQQGQPLIGYTGDSGYDEELYKLIFAAPNVIIDARTNSSYEHAGFEEVEKYVTSTIQDGQRVFLTGYGVSGEYSKRGVASCIQMLTGQQYAVHKAQHMHLSNNATRTSITTEYTSTVQGVTD